MEYVEVTPDDFELHWTSLDYERNFNEAKEVFIAGRRDNTKSGVLPISSLFTSGRLLLWEFASGLLYLREYCLHGNICDSAVILNLGEYGVVAEKFFSTVCEHDGSSSDCNSGHRAECRFLLRDATILSFHLQSKSADTSILLPFIEYFKGKIVDFSDSNVGMPEHRRLKITSVPDANGIIGGSWVSENELLVGLVGGNTMKVECTDIVLIETVLTDTTRLGTFIKGITRSLTQNEQVDTLAVSGDDRISISLDSSGILRMWSNSDSPCVFRRNLFEIIFEHMSIDSYSGIKLLAARLCVMRKKDFLILGIGAKGPGASTPVNDWKVTVLEFTVSETGNEVELRSHSPICSDEFITTNDSKITSVDFGFNKDDSSLVVNWEVTSSNAAEFTPGSQVLAVYNVDATNLGSEIHSNVAKNPLSERNRLLTIGDREMEDKNIHEPKNISITQLESKMLKRIFYPGRYPLTIIQSTLRNDIPYELQSLLAANEFKFRDSIADRVLFMCREWAGIMFQEKYDGVDRDFDDKLKFDCARKVFLVFLELCDKRMKKENILCKQSICSSCLSPNTLAFTCIAVRNLHLTYVLPMPLNADVVEHTPTNQFFMIVENFLSNEDVMQNSLSQLVDTFISRYYEENIFDVVKVNGFSLPELTESLQLLLRQSESFVSVVSELQNVMRNDYCNCVSVMEAIELRLNALNTPPSIQDSGLTKANDTCLFLGECGASLLSKVAAFTISDRYKRLKTLVVSGIFIAYHLSDSFHSSIHANFVDVYLPKAIAQLTYTSFMENLSTVNIAVGMSDEASASQDHKMLHRFLRWNTVTLPFSSKSSLRSAGLWNEIWRHLAPRVTRVWATEEEVLYSSQTSYFWYRISVLVSRMLRPTHVNDLVLSLRHLDHPARCFQALSIIDMFPSRNRSRTGLTGVFKCDKKLQLLLCCQRSNVALSSLVYGLKTRFLTSSSSRTDEMLIKKLVDHATSGLSMIVTERKTKVFDGPNVVITESSPVVSDLIYEWIKSFANDPDFDDVLMIGNFLFNASLSPEMNFVAQLLMSQFAVNDKTSFQCLDYLIDEFHELLRMFHNIEYLLSCLRQIDRFLDTDVSFDVNKSVSIRLWWRYVKEVDHLSVLLVKTFPSIQLLSNGMFRFWIASRKRDALSELINHCLTRHDLDGAYRGICELMSLENIAEDPEEQWKYSIRNMAVCACDDGRLDWLCSLPDKVVKDTSVFETIVSELEKVAIQSDVARGLQDSSTVASYYESLFALFICKKDYRRLATEAVSFKNRLLVDLDSALSLPRAKDALSLAIHGLCCLDSNHAYVINARGDMFTTIDGIKKDFVELMCQYSILSRGHNEYVIKDLISMVETLTSCSEYAEALSLIHSCNEPLELKSNLAKQVVESMADASIMRSSNNAQNMNIEKIDFYSNFSCTPVSYDHSIYSENLWNNSQDLLLQLREKDLQVFDCFMNKLIAATGRLPDSLRSLYSTCIDRGFCSIVESLLSHGDLVEACNVAESFLSSQSQEEKIKSCKYTIPYNTLDRLLKACYAVCEEVEAKTASFKMHKIDLNVLKASVNRLEVAIENYFYVLHGIDELAAY